MILDMYITTMPIIISGILNMLFTKTSIYKKYRYPIDRYKCLKDGKRILGDNKTYIGFISMIIISIVIQIIYGWVLKILNLEGHSELYNIHENQLLYNVLLGFLFGFIYMLLELPNSFFKRRIDIKPGETKKSFFGYLFLIIDQIDSLIGTMFVIYLFSNISFLKYIGYVIIGGITHLIINVILYKLKIRRNV